MPEGWRPRGVTRRPRSGAAAENARLRRRRNGLEELPKSEVGAAAGRSYPTSKVRGGSREELPCELPRGATLLMRSGAAAGRSYPMPQRPRPREAAGRSYPTPEARGGGQEDQQNVQGAVAARAQEGLEELSHVEGQR